MARIYKPVGPSSDKAVHQPAKETKGQKPTEEEKRKVDGEQK